MDEIVLQNEWPTKPGERPGPDLHICMYDLPEMTSSKDGAPPLFGGVATDLMGVSLIFSCQVWGGGQAISQVFIVLRIGRCRHEWSDESAQSLELWLTCCCSTFFFFLSSQTFQCYSEPAALAAATDTCMVSVEWQGLAGTGTLRFGTAPRTTCKVR